MFPPACRTSDPRAARRWMRGASARRAFVAVATLVTVASLARVPLAGAQDHEGHGGAAPSSSFQMHGFGDVDYAIERSKSAAGKVTQDGFLLGQFDLFMTAQLRPDLSFLAETVFESEEGGETVSDLERFFVRYAWSDAAKLAAGRTHTPLGYWNEAYHHGKLLQPSVERPLTLSFEDDGGILPIHSLGLELTGTFVLKGWDLAYATNLANGRGPTPEEVQTTGDENRSKAAGVKLTMIRTSDPVIQVGPVLYRDRIPAHPDTAFHQPNPIDELITGVHALVHVGELEVLSEYFHVAHDERGASGEWVHDSGYAIASLRRGRWLPYLGLEKRSIDGSDPFYASTSTATRSLLGIRLEVGVVNAIKVELRRTDENGVRHDGLAFQTAFTF